MDFFNNIQALTFDCYGTLVDWERGLARDLRAGLGATAATDEELLAFYAAAEPEAEAGVDRAFRNYKDVLRASLAGVALRAGTSVRDAGALVRGLPDWPIFEDTPRALQMLARKFKLCVVSNVDLDLFVKTNERLGVKFQEIVTADQVKSYKPGLLHFKEALRRLALAPSQVVHVAQSLYHDHVPAQSMGLATVWIDRRAGRAGGATPAAPTVKPDFIYHSLEEFAKAVSPRISRTC